MKSSPEIFQCYCRECGLEVPVTEYRFHDVRRFRFDFAWPEYKVALEVEGGVWSRGAHGRGSGIVRDIEKYNLATTMCWRIIRVQPNDLCMETTIKMIKETIKCQKENKCFCGSNRNV